MKVPNIKNLFDKYALVTKSLYTASLRSSLHFHPIIDAFPSMHVKEAALKHEAIGYTGRDM